MQKGSENSNNNDDPDITVNITSSTATPWAYPPPHSGLPMANQQYAGQYPTIQNMLGQNHALGSGNPSFAVAPFYDNNPLVFAQQLALQQQQSMQQQQQQQLLTYHLLTQNQGNFGTSDTAGHLNQSSANSNNCSQSFESQKIVQPPLPRQSETIMTAQTSSSRAINFDVPSNSNMMIPYSHLQQYHLNNQQQQLSQASTQSLEAAATAAKEKIPKRDNNSRIKEEEGVDMKQNSKRKRRHQEQKQSFQDTSEPIRKDPPEILNTDNLKIVPKPTKRRRQSETKEAKRSKVEYSLESEGKVVHLPGTQHAEKQQGSNVIPTSKKIKKQTNSEKKTYSQLPDLSPIPTESIVITEDRPLVTPYLFTLMSQFKRYVHDEREDRPTNQRSLGLQCIHCTVPDPQRYFHSNPTAMNKNLHCFHNHLLKCSGVPDEWKERMNELKEEHKTMKCQDRKSFLNGIFGRIHGISEKSEALDGPKKAPPRKVDNVKVNKSEISQSKKNENNITLKMADEKPLVRQSDEHLVSPLIVFVMNQYRRCTIKENEKYVKRWGVGFPGLECIHCTGQSPKKFFNNNVTNTSKNFAHFSKHLMECDGLTDKAKSHLSKLHDEYNKKISRAADREAFFNHIWERLFEDVDTSTKRTLIHPGDERLINAFTFTVLSQYGRCTLDRSNVNSSQSKYEQGHSGLECIHCAGPSSRKFFYRDEILLKNNFTRLYEHLSKCDCVPTTLKESLLQLRGERHKTDPLDRSTFFQNFWARLHSDSERAGSRKMKDTVQVERKKQNSTQRTSIKKHNTTGRIPCEKCRSKNARCNGSKRYCLYRVDSTVVRESTSNRKPVRTQQQNKSKLRDCDSPEPPVPDDTLLCKVVGQKSTQINYPHAPMGQLWLDKSLAQRELSDKNTVSIAQGGTLMGRRYVWDEGYYVDKRYDVGKRKITPILRGCTCGANHIYTETSTAAVNGRRSERAGGSTRTATVLEKLADGTLSPHTMVYPEDYATGPEHRFIKSTVDENVQPFSIRVSPDALFLADLHAHLSESEIIGFLGGHYSASEKCIYIQAAFPCKATDRYDTGATDVEMDPVSQIYAREAISNHGLSVVGWYHSHPTFQPNPSVTDIENQASYQQLFQGDNDAITNSEVESKTAIASPFVGLIIGTYDSQNPTSESVMRWFHVVSKKVHGKDVNYPMNLKTAHRHYRDLDNESRPTLTSQGAIIRRDLESKYLSCPVTNQTQSAQIESRELGSKVHSATSSTQSTDAHTHKKDVLQSHSVTKISANHERAIMESNLPAYLLSDSLFEESCRKSKSKKCEVQAALPLHFTVTEKDILQKDADTITNDVLAGIIWNAVEREQSKSETEGDSLLTASPSPSSRAIFELILRLSLDISDDLQYKLYEIMLSLEESVSEKNPSSAEMRFNDVDAFMCHNVDAVLSHYCSSNLKKINPFKTWKGAGDKGKNVDVDLNNSTPEPELNATHYYMTEVLQMSFDEVDKVYRGGSKMKRGHKIAVCLLKWARRMQLRPNFDALVRPYESFSQGELMFDSKSSTLQDAPTKNEYVFFVAEIMRLLAARWKEAAGKRR